MEYYSRRIVYWILFVLPLLTSACSTTAKVPEYKSSRMLPVLEVPPDLDVPVYNERMKIPDVSVAVEDATGDDMQTSRTAAPRSIEEPPVLTEEE